MTDKPDLDAAYSLTGPDDNRRLYSDWADTYDASFADALSYQLPAQVAQLFHQLGGTGPVLDVGAGTGLLAQALRPLCDATIDALDLSADMLSIAAQKGLYRDLIEADLTRPLPFKTTHYNGIVSSGTFTHGHVGPDAIDALLQIAKPGALFVLSVNSEHFEARGFAAKFKALAPQITDYSIRTVAIYGPDTAPDAANQHAQTKGHLASFRRI